ncbi:MAG: hypothetical protein LBD01_05055 [Puniceicoccales bacterium]|jgi:zinc protease|nr:hypothetical protein [Puniceicoccales bacterium]
MSFLFFPRQRASASALLLALVLLFFSACAVETNLVFPDDPWAHSYAVVVSRKTYAQADWRKVVDALVKKHLATLVLHDGDVATAREQLAAQMPRFTAFVAQPEECGRAFVAQVHRLSRSYDDDPWLDTLWGIITGATAADALRVVHTSAPLEIKRALATTSLKESLFDEYFLLRDGGNPPGGWFWKKPDGTTTHGTRETLGKSAAAAWAEQFAQAPDLVVTSSHGFENGVEMPLPLSDGIVRAHDDGALYAFADKRQYKPDASTKPIPDSTNPKVYFPVGNCLVGHVNGRHCMVTTMMGAYNVRQLVGYTVNTWHGAAWEMLSLWQALPRRNTFSECFFFTQQKILHDIAELDPKALAYKIKLGTGKVEIDVHLNDMLAAGVKFDRRQASLPGNTPDRRLAGLLWDMDTLAFYGDPAWRATFAKLESAFVSVGLDSKGNKHRLEVSINDRVQAVQNTAPIGIIFSRRIQNAKILKGEEYEPILADNFILLLKPQPKGAESEIIVEFEGDPISSAAPHQ